MKKFLSYIFTFVLLFAVSAFGTVYLSYYGKNQSLINPSLSVDGQGTSVSFFNGIIDAFGETKQFNVKGDLELQSGEDFLPIDFFVNIDISDMSNLKLSGFFNFEYQQIKSIIEFKFYNNTCYISTEGINVKIKTSTIKEFINNVTDLLPINNNQQSNSGGEDLLELLMPKLMSALDGMNDEVLENGDTRIELSLEGIADLVAVLNNKNMPKKIELKTAMIDGLLLNADIEFDFEQNIFISDPEVGLYAKEYFDLGKIKDLVSNAINLSNFKSNIELSLLGENKKDKIAIEVLANLDKKDFNVLLTENTFGFLNNVGISYLNNDLYVNVNNINILLNEKLINNLSIKIEDVLKELINGSDFASIPENIFNDVKNNLTEVSNINLMSYINLIKKFDLKEEEIRLTIDLSQLVEGQGVVDFVVGLENKKITSFIIEGFKYKEQTICLAVNIEETEELVDVENKEKYFDVYSIIDNNIQYFNSSAFDINLNTGLEINNNYYSCDANIKFDFRLPYIEFNSNILYNKEYSLFIVYEGDFAYINLNDIKIKVAIDRFEEVLKSFGITDVKQTVDFGQVINSKETNFDALEILKSLKTISIINNSIKVVVQGANFGFNEDIEILISLEDYLIKDIEISGLSFNDYKIDLGLQVNSNKLEKTKFNKNDYLDIFTLVDSVEKLTEIKEGSLFAKVNAEYNNKNFDFSINFNGNLEKEYFDFNLLLEGLLDVESNIIYKNNKAYLSVGDINIAISKDLINKLLGGFNSSKLLDSEVSKELKNKINKNFSKFDINYLSYIKDIKTSSGVIQIIIDKELFEIEKDVVIILQLYKSEIREIEVLNFEINEFKFDAKISVSTYPIQEVNVEENKYLDIDKFIDSIENITTANKYQLVAGLDVVNGDKNYNLLIDIIASKEGFNIFDLNNSYYSIIASLTGIYNNNLSVVYENEDAYILIDNIKIKVNKDKVVDIINQFGLNNKTIDLSKTHKIVNLLPKTENLSVTDILSAVKNIKISSHGIEIIVDGNCVNVDNEITIIIKVDSGDLVGFSLKGLSIKNHKIDLDVDLSINEINKPQIEKNEYLDVFEAVENIEQLLKTTEGSIDANINANVGGKEYNAELEFVASLEKEYASLILSLTGGLNIDLDVLYSNNQLNLSVEDINVSASKDLIINLLNHFNIESIIRKTNIKNSLKDVDIEIPQLNVSVLKYLKSIIISSSIIEIVVDKELLNSTDDIVIRINLKNNKLYSVEVENFKYNDVELTFNITISTEEIIERNINESEYLNIDNTLEGIENIINANGYDILGGLNIYEDGEKTFGLLLDLIASKESGLNFDLENSYYLIDAEFTGHVNERIFVVYEDQDAYISIGDIKVKVNKKDVEKVLAMLDIKMPTVDTTGIIEGISIKPPSFEDINIKELISSVKTISISGTGINLVVDGTMFGIESNIVLNVAIERGNIVGLYLSGLEIDGKEIELDVNLEINNTERRVFNKDEYLDVAKLVNSLDELTKATEGSIIANIEANILGKEYNADLEFVGSLEKEYLSLILALSGEIKLNTDILYKDNQLNVAFDNIKISTSKELIFGLIDKLDLKSLIKDVDVEDKLNNIDIQMPNLDISMLKYIKSVVVSSSEIEIVLDKELLNSTDDIVIRINLKNNKLYSVEVENFKYNDVELTFNITISTEEIIERNINESEYLNIDNTLEGIENIVNANGYDILGGLNIYEDGEKTFGLLLDLIASKESGLNFDLENSYYLIDAEFTGHVNERIFIVYEDQDAYLSIGDIKVKVNKKDVESVLAMLDVKMPTVDTTGITEEVSKKLPSFEDINIKELISSVKTISISGTGINLVVDGTMFGIGSNIVLNVAIENGNIVGLYLSGLDIDGKEIELDVNLEINNAERRVFNKDEYLDVVGLINGLKELIESNNIQIEGLVDVYSQGVKELGLDLTLMKRQVSVDLMGYLNAVLTYGDESVNLESHYLKETMFANLNGLKVLFEKERLKETLDTGLTLAGQSPEAFSGIIDKVLRILDGESIISVLSQEINNVSINSTKTSSLDIMQIVEQLLNNVTINAGVVSINVDGSVFGMGSQINAEINIKDNIIKAIAINNLLIEGKELAVNLSLDIKDQILPTISIEEQEKYLNISEVVDLADKTYDTLKNLAVSGNINLQFEFLNELHNLYVNYGIKLEGNQIVGYIKTNFKGLDVNVYYKDQTFYLDIVGLKIFVEFEEINDIIDWANKEFGLGLDFDLSEINNLFSSANQINMSEISIESIFGIVNNIDFSLTENFIVQNGYAEGSIAGTTITVQYSDTVEKVTFSQGELVAELICSSFDNFELESLVVSEYEHYSMIIDTYDSVVNTLKAQQYSVDANAQVIVNNNILHNVDIDLDIDILNTIKAYASVDVSGKTNVMVNAAYDEDMIYFNYDNLKLSINQLNLREILVIALEVIGFDSKTIGFLGDIAEDMDITSENINNIMPELKMDNPLNMLGIIKNIDIIDGDFIILLDGKRVLNSENAKDMTFVLSTKDNVVDKISLLNMYSGKENQEYFNLVINFNKFTTVNDVQDKSSYIDISDSSQLLKAFVNTSELDDYTINGTIQVVANVIGINIDMDVPLTAKVKILEDDIEVYAIMDVPVVGSNVPGFTGININNDVPYVFGDTSVKSRKLEIMIKDGFVYIYRNDVMNRTVFASRTYEKQLKVSLSEFTSDIMYYLLQYGIGLSQTLMTEISKSMQQSLNRETPIDMSNVLLGYDMLGTNVHQIVINLCEIANNQMLDRAAVDIHIKNDASTQNKDFIGMLVFDMNMPLASAVEMNLKTDNLSLTDIGVAVDMTRLRTFVNSYAYKENQQMENNDGDGWTLASEKKYTIKFVDPMGNSVNNIEASVGSAISLPSLSTIVQDKGDGVYTYTFDGWYTTSNYKNGTKFEKTTMPRGDVELYAKWSESYVLRKMLTFNSLGGESVESKYDLVGASITLPNLQDKIVVDGQIKITYQFTGWYSDIDCTSLYTLTTMPNEDTTLYAGWKEKCRVVAYKLIVIDDGTEVFNSYIGEGLSIELSGFYFDNYTKYYLDQGFTTEYTISTMPNYDLTIYVRNRYSLNIISLYGTIYDYTEYYYQGTEYSLPDQNSYIEDDGESRVEYTFNGWSGNTKYMPNQNHKVVADWTIVTKRYYTVTFNLCYNGNSAFYDDAKLYRNGQLLGSQKVSIKVLEGELNLSEFYAEWKYTTGSWIFEVDWWYNFQGFSTSKNGSKMNSVNITGNTTIYGLWSGLKS